MSEILSQSQIDSLLNELSSGEISYEAIEVKNSAKKVKDYDFKSPKKFTKEQLKLLHSIYDNFSRHLASYFSGVLRTYCQITVNTIEEQPYYEYNNALPDSILIGRFDMRPLEGSVMVDVSNTISFALIEMLLGGSGSAGVYNREFTEIEIALMEKIFKQIGKFSTESWSNYLEIEPTLKNIETNARLIQSISMDEAVVIIVMDADINQTKGTLSFCFPCMSLEPIVDKINKNYLYTKKKIDNDQENAIKQAISHNIRSSEIEIRGVFGRTELSLREILNLSVGDVIKLDQSIESDIKLIINEKTWFYGVPGIRKNKKVIKANKVV